MTIRESRKRLSEAEEVYKSAHPGRDLTEAREELTHARTEYQLDCVAVVERLDYLLGPFYLEGVKWPRAAQDMQALTLEDGDDLEFTVGDLRALAALYEEVKDA
jgi:hypothetical protein